MPRGRKSKDPRSNVGEIELNGDESSTHLAVVKRLIPPAALSKEARDIWIMTIDGHPADTFELYHAPMLEAYCVHTVEARRIGDMIEDFYRRRKEPDNIFILDEANKVLDRMLAMRERETRAASSLATRLRITRQAIHQLTAARGNKKPSSGTTKPWEDGDGD